MSKILRASLLAILGMTSAAGAADLPRRTAPPADYYAPPPMFSWTGFYLGLNAGGGFGTLSNGTSQLFGRPGGVLGGLTAGYNFQTSPNFVVGIEGDVDASSLGATSQLPFFGFNGGSKLTMLSTVRGRVGYSVNRALFYATGGLAFASVSAFVNDWRTLPFFGSQSSLQVGFAAGAGVEYAITDHISAKAEYLYVGTGSRDYFQNTFDRSSIGVSVSTLRAGVNYHF